jgi:trehalose-6-phosphate synthase
MAQVGLVTPLQDGMNLVAKEYVAAQNPSDPGVLVLSEFAGAARELDTAVLVNPHDIDGMAQKISKALGMGIEERRERWSTMVAKLRSTSIQSWFSDFIAELAEVRRTALPISARRFPPLPFGRTERSLAADPLRIPLEPELVKGPSRRRQDAAGP